MTSTSPRNACPRWLIASFSSGVSSAFVRRARRRRRSGRSRSHPMPRRARISRPGIRPADGRTSGRRAAPAPPSTRTTPSARSSGTSAICASSRSRFASSSPCLPDQRALKMPGMPPITSTASPESSATVGKAGVRGALARLEQRVLVERQTLSGTSTYARRRTCRRSTSTMPATAASRIRCSSTQLLRVARGQQDLHRRASSAERGGERGRLQLGELGAAGDARGRAACPARPGRTRCARRCPAPRRTRRSRYRRCSCRRRPCRPRRSRGRVGVRRRSRRR